MFITPMNTIIYGVCNLCQVMVCPGWGCLDQSTQMTKRIYH